MQVSSVIPKPFCKCGEHLDLSHRNGQLKRNYDAKFFGGNVEGLFPGQCPKCKEDLTLCAVHVGKTWDVIAVAYGVNTEKEIVVKQDDFDAMDKPTLRKWLDDRGIPYTPQWGEERLRQHCRENK